MRNILGSDVQITGVVKFAQELVFNGTLDGEIVSDGTLIIGKSAIVEGEVRTKTVVVHGSVIGNIIVSDRCELKAGATLNGNLKASRILVEEGATFIGKSEVTTKTGNAMPESGKVPKAAASITADRK